jgi:hypothetical protein
MFEIIRGRLDGALLLKSGRLKKIVFLHKGTPIYVKSNIKTETLGKVLVQEGMISEQQCEDSLEIMNETGQLQGRTLLDLGYISPLSLLYGLRRQLMLRLFDLFTWQSGSYKYKPEHDAPPARVPLASTTAAVILEGVKKSYSETRLRQILKRFLDMIPVPAQGTPTGGFHLDLDAVDERILGQIDGIRTLQRILQLDDDPTRVLQLAYTLHCFGLITFRTRLEDDVTLELPGRQPPGGE